MAKDRKKKARQNELAGADELAGGQANAAEAGAQAAPADAPAVDAPVAAQAAEIPAAAPPADAPAAPAPPAEVQAPASGTIANTEDPRVPAASARPAAAARAQEPRAQLQPWFGNDGGGLGIAGTARRPGTPGTHITAPSSRAGTNAPGSRQPPAVPAASQWPARLGNETKRPSIPAGERTVRHVGTATRDGLSLDARAGASPFRPAQPSAPAPAATPKPATTGRIVRHVGTATRDGLSPSLPPPAAAAAGSEDAAPETRTIVRVSMAQAAAAGNETLRAPPQAARARQVTRAPQSAAAAPAEEKKREIAPALPLAIPAADSLYLAIEGGGTPGGDARIERALRAIPGVTDAGSNIAAGLVAISPASTDRAAIEEALAAAGHPLRADPPSRDAMRQQARRLALAAASTAAVGLAAWAIGAHTNAGPIPGTIIAAASLATAWPLLQQTIRQLIHGKLAVEIVPIAAALAVLLAAGLAPGPSPALAALPLVAHLAIAASARLAGARTLGLLEAMHAALPGGDAPRSGTLLELEPGAIVPVDGRLQAPAILDERPIGGEEEVERLAGEAVAAGARLPGGGRLAVESGSGSSRLARGHRIAMRAIATAPGGGRLGGWAAWLLIPGSLAAGVAAGIVSGPWAAAAVLAGAAPLALGMAARLATNAGLTSAASRGVAIRSGAALERAAKTRTVVFDKGGILTRGDAAVLDLQIKPGRALREVLGAAAAAEAGIDHGIARALAAHARDLDVPLPTATDRRHLPGLGVQAQVAGARITVGSPRFALQAGIELGLLIQPIEELARRGRTPLVIAFDEEAVAVLGIAETPQENARQAMGSLELLELDIQVASEDATASVQWLTEAIGLEKRRGRGDLSPEQKASWIRELRAGGGCLVTGSNSTDAGSFAAADLAVATGADPTVEAAAGALLVREDPQGVVELVRAGRAARRGSNAAICFGLAGNASAMGLAAMGSIGVGGAAFLSLAFSLLALGAASSPWLRVR